MQNIIQLWQKVKRPQWPPRGVLVMAPWSGPQIVKLYQVSCFYDKVNDLFAYHLDCLGTFLSSSQQVCDDEQ